MGSPAQNLRIPERLRPWYEAGLELVLAPELTPFRREAAVRMERRVSGRQPNFSFTFLPLREGRRASVPGTGSQSVASRPVLASSDAHGAPEQPVPTAPSSGQHGESGLPLPGRWRRPGSDLERRTCLSASSDRCAAPHTLDLPVPWGGFRVPPAPRIAWTYFDLGLDLGGRTDAGRRTLFRGLVRDLAWPSGTIAFWPAAVLAPEGADALIPSAELFWRGMDAMGLRQVACFGRRALSVICPGAEPSAVRHITEAGHVVLILPGPGDLLALLPHDRHRALSALAELDF